MAITEAIREVLAEDDVLAALLVGGIYHYEQTGRSGISRLTTPNAYDAAGFLQPCAVLKAGETREARPIRDTQPGIRQLVEVYLYDDGDSGYGALLTARDLIVALLDRRWIDGAGLGASGAHMRWVGGADDLRDPKLNNAALVRLDFAVTT